MSRRLIDGWDLTNNIKYSAADCAQGSSSWSFLRVYFTPDWRLGLLEAIQTLSKVPIIESVGRKKISKNMLNAIECEIVLTVV